MNSRIRTLTTVTLLTLSGIVHSSEASLAEQAAQAMERAQGGEQPEAPVITPTTPQAYPWDQVLVAAEAKVREEAELKTLPPTPADSPAQDDVTAVSVEEHLPPPVSVDETAAQRYYRIVEDSKLMLPAQPTDHLGNMLRRMELEPWPPGQGDEG